MKTNHKRQVSVMQLLAAVMLGAMSASAQITIVDIPLTDSDANSGISSSNIYTHALDFGSQTGVAAYSINGVPITQAGISGNTFSGTDATSVKAWSLTGNSQWHPGNDNTRTDGNMSKMLRDMYVPFGGAYTLTLSGLTVGKNYSTRLYYRPWDNNGTRNATLTFNGDGTPAPITINEDAGTDAHYVAYAFTASGESMTVGFDSQAWHLYGMTNQELDSQPDPYDTWKVGAFANSFIDNVPANDPDDDGLSNFEEFAFGLDPTTGTLVNPITDTSTLKSAGIFSYTRYATSGLTYTVWASTDLQDWGTEPVTLLSEEPGPINPLTGVQTVVVELPTPQSGNYFIRVAAD